MTDRQKRIVAIEREWAGEDWTPLELAAHANAVLAELYCDMAEKLGPDWLARDCAETMIALYRLADACGGDLESAWQRSARLREGTILAVEAARTHYPGVYCNLEDPLWAMWALLNRALAGPRQGETDEQWRRDLVAGAGDVAVAIGAAARRNDCALFDAIERELTERRRANRSAREARRGRREH